MTQIEMLNKITREWNGWQVSEWETYHELKLYNAHIACKVAEQAIGEYAKQDAIEFADWITASGYSISHEKSVWSHDMDFMTEEPKTTAELYEQFKQEGDNK